MGFNSGFKGLKPLTN